MELKASKESTSSYEYVASNDDTHININKHVNNKGGVLKTSNQQRARKACGSRHQFILLPGRRFKYIRTST